VQRGAIAFVFLGNLIGALLGLGAVVAGANTTYAAMARRIREMGTLRALGFGRRSVGSVLLVESILIGVAGGVGGAALALLFDGFGLSLMGLAFELEVTPAALGRGLLLALAIGVLGALLPARAASRLEIVEALRRV
jgi:putative ABC transport system permease protein